MSLEVIFSKFPESEGTFKYNLSTYFKTNNIKAPLEDSEQLEKKVDPIEIDVEVKSSHSKMSKKVDSEYLKKIGIQMKGPQSYSSDKKIVISLNVEDDSAIGIDTMKKTLESLKESISYFSNLYKLSANDFAIFINFMSLNQSNLKFFIGKNDPMILKTMLDSRFSDNCEHDKNFMYCKLKFKLEEDINRFKLQNNHDDILKEDNNKNQPFNNENPNCSIQLKDIEIIGIYQPSMTHFQIQRLFFIGILPDIKLRSVSLSDPIFFLNLENGSLLQENTLTLLLNSMIQSDETNYSPPDEKNMRYFEEIGTTTILDINEVHLSTCFVQHSTKFTEREHSIPANITSYEETLNSVYENSYKNITSTIELSKYIFAYKYSLKHYKELTDYFIERLEFNCILNYENNYYLHLTRFPLYITNEMQLNTEFVSDAIVDLYIPHHSYISWVENRNNIKSTQIAKGFFFLDYCVKIFKCEGFYSRNLIYFFDLFYFCFDYLFPSIFLIISFIILQYTFKSQYGAYTMMLYYPVFFVIALTIFYTARPKKLEYHVMSVNGAFHLYYLFLIICGIIALAKVFNDSSFTQETNKAAFGVLLVFNFFYYLIPYVINFRSTLTLLGTVSGFETLAFAPNYSSLFLFGSLNNIFNSYFHYMHALNLISFLVCNFLLGFVLFRISFETGQRGVLGLALIYTILHSIKFLMIIGNYLYYHFKKSNSIHSPNNKNSVIEFWRLTRNLYYKNQENLKKEIAIINETNNSKMPGEDLNKKNKSKSNNNYGRSESSFEILDKEKNNQNFSNYEKENNDANDNNFKENISSSNIVLTRKKYNHEKDDHMNDNNQNYLESNANDIHNIKNKNFNNDSYEHIDKEDIEEDNVDDEKHYQSEANSQVYQNENDHYSNRSDEFKDIHEISNTVQNKQFNDTVPVKEDAIEEIEEVEELM